MEDVFNERYVFTRLTGNSKKKWRRVMSEKFSNIESVEYPKGAIVSKAIIDNESGSVTIFAFDKGQGLSEHSAPFDALANILDGSVEITLENKPVTLTAGESILMPANIPHALKAVEKFKMMLIMIKN
jgi:quercetin dioxygenase-like cupin family protein